MKSKGHRIFDIEPKSENLRALSEIQARLHRKGYSKWEMEDYFLLNITLYFYDKRENRRCYLLEAIDPEYYPELERIFLSYKQFNPSKGKSRGNDQNGNQPEA